MKKLILFLTIIVSLNADILKETKIDKIEKQKEKSELESSLLKDSWINPLNIDATISENKSSDTKTKSKRVYLNFDQDIFRSGGILYTIEKANVKNKLANEVYANDLDTQKIEALKLILNIRKIDLQIKKQDYLIKNKKIEIAKKEEEYLNGTSSIEDLDTAIIEKNELENQIEDLKISKYNLIKEFKKFSSKSYKKIKPMELRIINLQEFLDKNRSLVINKLNSSISKYDEDIVSSNYLPKISVFSQFGLEDNDKSQSNDKFYNYGFKLTIPLDYNMNKNKEISKLNYKLSKLEENIKKEEEINIYKTIFVSLEHIDKKINNSKSTIKKYKTIYNLTNDLVKGFLKTKEDLKIIENRLNSSKLDIDILNFDKQLLIYEINKNLKMKNDY